MKLAKNFTDGLAVFLAVLIAIYLLTGYVKFNPDESKLEDGSTKAELFLEASILNRQYFHLFLWVSLSALAGFVLRRSPWWCVMTSVSALAYALSLHDNNGLTVHPMFILCFLLCHAGGALVFAASEDRAGGRAGCLRASLLCSASGLTVSAVCAVFQSRAAQVADIIKELTDINVLLHPKLNSYPDLINMIYLHYRNFGSSSARDMATKYARDIKADGLVQYFYNSIDYEDLKAYLRLCLLIFACAVLALVLRRHFSGPVVAAVPAVYAFIILQLESLSAMPMFILVFTVCAALCSLAYFEQYGKPPVSQCEETDAAEAAAEAAGDDPNSDMGDEPTAEDNADDGEEEIYYT